jgi:hypothetical protein
MKSETIMLQVIVNGQRNWVELTRFGNLNRLLYTMHLVGQDMMGESAAAEASTLEDVITKFCLRWEQWNECGPW